MIENQTKPITLKDALASKSNAIPPEVIDAFNGLIVKNIQGKSAVVLQKDVVATISERMECSKEHVYKNAWLDIEPIFEDAGWRVNYDKPGYNETYEASFTFTWKGKPTPYVTGE